MAADLDDLVGVLGSGDLAFDGPGGGRLAGRSQFQADAKRGAAGGEMIDQLRVDGRERRRGDLRRARLVVERAGVRLAADAGGQ